MRAVAATVAALIVLSGTTEAAEPETTRVCVARIEPGPGEGNFIYTVRVSGRISKEYGGLAVVALDATDAGWFQLGTGIARAKGDIEKSRRFGVLNVSAYPLDLYVVGMDTDGYDTAATDARNGKFYTKAEVLKMAVSAPCTVKLDDQDAEPYATQSCQCP